MRRLDRNITITGSVVLFHLAALWALQAGLLRRAVEIVVPVDMVSELLAPAAPKVDPAPPPRAAEPLKPPMPKQLERVVPSAPQPTAIADPRPAPNAPTGISAPQPPAPPTAAAAVTPAPAPAKLELPYSNADYLQNPKPAYPPLSKRLGEQGKVELRVLIGADGMPQKAELAKSSGFDRLDQAALATILKWRFVPGKRGGVPEAAWAHVPIDFVLE
ncbi:MAG: tonB [Ramlibacter sp.]|nr:tonB [Ramlibacter sp.]